jgi:hypothetical protein
MKLIDKGRAWIGGRLRRLADRIDEAGAPRAMHWTFTFEDREGIRFREDGKGCRLWYMGDADFERAHSDADTAHVRVDWTNMTARYVGGGGQLDGRRRPAPRGPARSRLHPRPGAQVHYSASSASAKP